MVDIHIKMHSCPDCTCVDYDPKRRGLPMKMNNHISKIVETVANVKASKTKDDIIQQQMNTPTSE